MDSLPKVLQDMIYKINTKSDFKQVMAELKGVAKYETGIGGLPDRIEYEIQWIGYKPKVVSDGSGDVYTLEPFLPSKPLWDSKLCFENPHFQIYVNGRILTLNRQCLPYSQKNKLPEIFRKCEPFEKINRKQLVYLLGEYV